MNTLQTRILLGVVMFALFFGVLCLDLIFHTDIGFGCLAVLAGIIGLHEFYNTAKMVFLRSGCLVLAQGCGCLFYIGYL